MFVIITELSVRPDMVDAFLELTQLQAHHILQGNSGCIRFDICQAEGVRSQILLYEAFEDWVTYETHMDSGLFAQFNEKMGTMLNSDPVIRPFTLTNQTSIAQGSS